METIDRNLHGGSPQHSDTLPTGTNLLKILQEATTVARDDGQAMYVFQTWGGEWCYSPYAPADDPFVLINADGSSRAGCDFCESDARRRHRELGQRPCPACDAPALVYASMGRVQCAACGEEAAL